jgi:hypothetical protein
MLNVAPVPGQSWEGNAWRWLWHVLVVQPPSRKGLRGIIVFWIGARVHTHLGPCPVEIVELAMPLLGLLNL